MHSAGATTDLSTNMTEAIEKIQQLVSQIELVSMDSLEEILRKTDQVNAPASPPPFVRPTPAIDRGPDYPPPGFTVLGVSVVAYKVLLQIPRQEVRSRPNTVGGR